MASTDEDTRATLDEINALYLAMKPVVEASVRYYDCLCEFDGEDSSFCSDHSDRWDDAVYEYKKQTKSRKP